MTVVRAELPDLAVKVGAVALELVRGALESGVVTHGMVPVAEVGIVRVMPVDEGVVDADAQPFSAEGLHVLADEVPTRRRARRLVVSEGAVEETEAVVVLRRHDRVAHPRPPGRARPCTRIVAIRGELIEEGLVGLCGNALVASHPLPASRNGIQSPVDEHPESVMAEPFRPARACFPLGFLSCHGVSLPHLG